MRIGFDAKRAFYNRSGLGNYSRDTIVSLANLYPGHEYYLYTPEKKNSIDFLPKKKNIKLMRPSGINKLSQSYWRSISLGTRLIKDKIDIYHGLSNELPANIIQAGLKKVVTIHDLIFMRYPELYKSVDREIYQQKFFEACLAADKIVAISEQTKEDIVSFFHVKRDDVKVIYQGCNPKFYEMLSAENKAAIREKYRLPQQFILSVGTIEKRKNFLNVLKAIHQGNLDIVVVFVGRETGYKKELQVYIRQHNLDDRVMFLHNVPNADLPAIYQMAEIFIYSSIFEGFGIPILEALNSNVPVITNRFGCFKEAAGPHAYYVNPNEPDEIAQAVTEVLSDSEKRERMTNEGKKHADNFKQKIITEKLMDLYKSLM